MFFDVFDNNVVVMKVVDGINNVSVVVNLYVIMTFVEFIFIDFVYLNVDGGIFVVIIVKNGIVFFLSILC